MITLRRCRSLRRVREGYTTVDEGEDKATRADNRHFLRERCLAFLSSCSHSFHFHLSASGCSTVYQSLYLGFLQIAEKRCIWILPSWIACSWLLFRKTTSAPHCHMVFSSVTLLRVSSTHYSVPKDKALLCPRFTPIFKSLSPTSDSAQSHGP